MSIYTPGKGQEYQQVLIDEAGIRKITVELRKLSSYETLLENLVIPGSTLNPKQYESYWGSEEIARQESGKNIPEIMMDLFAEIEKSRISRDADIALVQDLKINTSRSSTSASVRLLLLNRK